MTARRHILAQAEDSEAPRVPNTRMWLNAGAVTLGVGAAMVAGAAAASADAGADSGSPAGHSTSNQANAHAVSSTQAKSRNASAPKTSTRKVTVAVLPTPISRTPSANALRVASTTARAITQPVALAAPTPNSILQGLAEFGHNVYLTITDQITVAQNNLAVLGEDLLTVLGISRETITGSGIYGNPAQNKQYYVATTYETAPLAAVAMAYGQLTGTDPDLKGFMDLARTTQSLAQPAYKVWSGPGDFVIPSDSYELLQDKNVRIITSNYYNDQQSKAINDLSAGLSDPTSVLIAQITGPVDGQTVPKSKQVIVLGLDTTRGIVTINDPTQTTGKGLEMTLDDFTKQWSAQDYQLVTTQLAASSSTPLPEPATKLVWSLPAPNQIGQALQAGLTNIAQLVVHQIQGAQTGLGVLANDLSYTFGINDPNIAPPAPQSIEYGDYTKNYPYYVYQGDYPTCLIMATAAIIGQLRGGPMPADLGQQVLDQATSTPSGVYVNQMIFEPGGQGMKVNGLHWGTNSADALKLLNMNGVNADWTTYLKSQSDVAMDIMLNALSERQGVIVSLSSNIIQNAYTRKYFGFNWIDPGPNGPVSDHAVVVISVDLTKEVVYINDSAWENGQGLPIPLDEFKMAWQLSGYSLITAG